MYRCNSQSCGSGANRRSSAVGCLFGQKRERIHYEPLGDSLNRPQGQVRACNNSLWSVSISERRRVWRACHHAT